MCARATAGVNGGRFGKLLLSENCVPPLKTANSHTHLVAFNFIFSCAAIGRTRTIRRSFLSLNAEILTHAMTNTRIRGFIVYVETYAPPHIYRLSFSISFTVAICSISLSLSVWFNDGSDARILSGEIIPCSHAINFLRFFFSHSIEMLMMIVESMHFHHRTPLATLCPTKHIHTHTLHTIHPYSRCCRVRSWVRSTHMQFRMEFHYIYANTTPSNNTFCYREFIINSKRQPTKKIPFHILFVFFFFCYFQINFFFLTVNGY